MTGQRDAATKARRCFALAKSTTFDGEREAAISRGLAILEKAGLNPDQFDIPGRERKPQQTCPHGHSIAGGNWCPQCADAEFRRQTRQRGPRTRNVHVDMNAKPTAQYWTQGGTLYCKHGPILYGTACVRCEREAKGEPYPEPPPFAQFHEFGSKPTGRPFYGDATRPELDLSSLAAAFAAAGIDVEQMLRESVREAFEKRHGRKP